MLLNIKVLSKQLQLMSALIFPPFYFICKWINIPETKTFPITLEMLQFLL